MNLNLVCAIMIFICLKCRIFNQYSKFKTHVKMWEWNIRNFVPIIMECWLISYPNTWMSAPVHFHWNVEVPPPPDFNRCPTTSIFQGDYFSKKRTGHAKHVSVQFYGEGCSTVTLDQRFQRAFKPKQPYAGRATGPAVGFSTATLIQGISLSSLFQICFNQHQRILFLCPCHFLSDKARQAIVKQSCGTSNVFWI